MNDNLLKFEGGMVLSFQKNQVVALSCAYYAVAYLQFKSSREFKYSFVIGKLRIAPIKENSFSIQKLEPQTAVVPSRIKAKIMEELK